MSVVSLCMHEPGTSIPPIVAAGSEASFHFRTLINDASHTPDAQRREDHVIVACGLTWLHSWSTNSRIFLTLSSYLYPVAFVALGLLLPADARKGSSGVSVSHRRSQICEYRSPSFVMSKAPTQQYSPMLLCQVHPQT